jgi:hypothetical protein
MLSAIFVAVPALSRVDPAMTSGPTANAIVRSTGGHAHDHVLPARPQPRHRAGAFLVVVFDALLCPEGGAAAARDHGLDERRVGAEGRRHLRRFEHAETPAGASADEDDAAALPQAFRDDLGTERDPLPLTLHGCNHLAILGEHELDDLRGRQLVDAERRGVDRFGRQRLPLRTKRHVENLWVRAYPPRNA